MSGERESLREALRECVGDAYWIMLSPGPGNAPSARRLYENLVQLVARAAVSGEAGNG